MKKHEMRMNAAISRAKRTALGRVLCRLFGDRAGGVMLEYVMLAVLIAAAVAALVWWLGRTIGGGIKTSGDAVFNPTTAGNTYTTQKGQSTTDKGTAEAQSEQFK